MSSVYAGDVIKLFLIVIVSELLQLVFLLAMGHELREIIGVHQGETLVVADQSMFTLHALMFVSKFDGGAVIGSCVCIRWLRNPAIISWFVLDHDALLLHVAS
jgi:hypothetical protein